MNMKPNLSIIDLMKYNSPTLTKKEWFDFAIRTNRTININIIIIKLI